MLCARSATGLEPEPMNERDANAINPNPVAAPSSPENEEAVIYERATRRPWGIEWTAERAWIGPLRKDGSGKVSEIVTWFALGGLKPEYLEESMQNARLIVDAVNVFNLPSAHESESVPTPSPLGKEEAIAREAAKQIEDALYEVGGDIAATEALAQPLIEAAISRALAARQQPAQRPRIKNLKMLDAIHAAVIEHSGNGLLADEIVEFLKWTEQPAQKPQEWRDGVKFLAETVREILKDRSKGEVETWGFVAMFMDMITEAEKRANEHA